MAKLNAGYNITIMQKLGSGDSKPIYPYTKTDNVFDAEGKSMTSILEGINADASLHHVPDFAEEDSSNKLRFLHNDNKWATIPDATTEEKGVVMLYNGTDSTDTTKAATANAVNLLKQDLETLKTEDDAKYVQQSQIGAKTADGTKGVASLDENGMVPTAQLPSFVSDVFDVKLSNEVMGGEQEDEPTGAYSTAVTADGDLPVEPKTNAIYVWSGGDGANFNTYRWSGTAYVEISKSLSVGDNAGQAFDGAKGKEIYDWMKDTGAHARVDATKVEASEKNGYIKVDEAEVKVYEHPIKEDGGSEDNPHGITQATIGLDKVENKTAEDILNELTTTQWRNALGLDVEGPNASAVKATATVDGIMSKEQAAKLDGCKEIAVAELEPSFTSGEGIWFKIESTDPAE